MTSGTISHRDARSARGARRPRGSALHRLVSIGLAWGLAGASLGWSHDFSVEAIDVAPQRQGLEVTVAFGVAVNHGDALVARGGPGIDVEFRVEYRRAGKTLAAASVFRTFTQCETGACSTTCNDRCEIPTCNTCATWPDGSGEVALVGECDYAKLPCRIDGKDLTYSCEVCDDAVSRQTFHLLVETMKGDQLVASVVPSGITELDRTDNTLAITL